MWVMRWERLGVAMTTDAAQLSLEDAVQRAEAHADDQWMEDARQALVVCARRGSEFTTDEVWSWLDWFSTATTHDPRAMGAVMRWAVQARLIEPTDRYTKSERPACHKRPVRVWRPVTIGANSVH
jgi:hypothetical protein